MSVITSVPYHRAVDRVSRWCSWYTREVDVHAAEGRRDELASDLYEHAIWAEKSGASPRRVARSILSRALRGAPADLSWRHAQRRQIALADPTGFHLRRVEGALSALVLVVASAVLGWGLFVLTRIALSSISGEIRPGSATALTIVSFVAVAIGALVLLSRRRSRFLGALLMVLASFGLVHFGLFQMYSLSATVGALTFTMPGWDLASNTLIAGLGAFFIAAAIWWWPEHRTSSADTGTRLKTIGEMAR
ncbi:hypothetical protein QMG61_04605 [Cryobacterium sp. PH31-AA6]|uniref:hypothetical protein n=1 Tax=Cryobacterium sp. PH31-AA6 TaxID=3046205 RepID=UPI0024BA69F7|nr:hypothetical protein [Cryobacterium sp. PH31-AA6]MDJ0323044.1 hypothetical protein [Cryobacterium sp. PH31-AA6]